MNAGQYLVALSGLPSASAGAHLLAIQAGTGPSQTIFAARMCVVTGESRMDVVHRAKRQVPKPASEVRQPAPVPKQISGNKSAHAFRRTFNVSAFTQTDSVTVTRRQHSVTTVSDLPSVAVSIKKKAG